MKNYEKLSQIDTSKPVCLIGHIDPDADALASMIVLKDFLINYLECSQVDIFADCKQIPENCLEILDNEPINMDEKNYHTVIVLDSPNSERIGIYKHLFDCTPEKFVIDHHATNQHFGNINIVEMCSSTCEIIYEILKFYNYKISFENQGKLYAGIITDTNNFTVGNIGSRTHLIVSEIIENINRNEIYNHFLQNNSLKQMEMLSLAINNLSSIDSGKILISHITKKEAIDKRADFEDFASIVNKLSRISKSKLICFIYPKGHQYYVSLRAQHGYDISKIAVKNNGGGHTGAAAFLTDNDNLKEIKQNIINEFQILLKNNLKTTNKLF